MLLERINDPSDLKELAIEDKKILAKEMRSAIIDRTSKIGGHLGSNLATVELTIALHSVFNSPVDKIVFDVSHQTYTHKMLTGRKKSFINENYYRNTSLYSNPSESEHDFFNIGHTSTSISLAYGLAKARDLLGSNENIIAIIGDGALSGGEAFEGLNCASNLMSNFIIIVNDNEMAIAENHGGLYPSLQKLRETNGESSANIFKSLGFKYKYISDGHDINAIEKVLKEVKGINCPYIIHIHTSKGRGLDFAEKDKEPWHWCGPFDKLTGISHRKISGENYDRILRDYMLQKMQSDPGVIAIVAGVPGTMGFNLDKREEAGVQFLDVGIAESTGVSIASGIARGGGKPVFTTDSTFMQRAFDQISQDLCINECPATLLVRNASIWGANDATHLGIFDIPLLSNIPNLVYLAPTNKEEYLSMLDWSIEQTKYPVAIRIPRNGVHHSKNVVEDDYSSILNKYKIVQNGQKVAVLALGDFFQIGEKLADFIDEQLQIQPTLINPRFITGLDQNLLNSLKGTHELIVTLEDGIIDGGFGQKISAFFGASSVKTLCYGFQKKFLDRYKVDEILAQNRIRPDLIVDDIKAILC